MAADFEWLAKAKVEGKLQSASTFKAGQKQVQDVKKTRVQ